MKKNHCDNCSHNHNGSCDNNTDCELFNKKKHIFQIPTKEAWAKHILEMQNDTKHYKRTNSFREDWQQEEIDPDSPIGKARQAIKKARGEI